MKTSPNEFKKTFLDGLLQVLWRQWSTLGVAGSEEINDPLLVDPEALLAFTCTLGRYDPRLFDEVIDWLLVNERFINVQRLRNIMRNEGFRGQNVLATLAGVMSEQGKANKWRRLAKTGSEDVEESFLFLRSDNTALPLVGAPAPLFKKHGWLRNPLRLRGLSSSFPVEGNPGLWLRLRSLFGVNARCEIVLYLLVAGSANSSEVARQTHYFHRTIQDALSEMNRSGLLWSQRYGRERRYSLASPDKWKALLECDGGDVKWLCWPPLFSALEAIWMCIQSDAFGNMSPMLQMSELRKVMHEEAEDKLVRSNVNHALPDSERIPGMQYLDKLVDHINTILETIK